MPDELKEGSLGQTPVSKRTLLAGATGLAAVTAGLVGSADTASANPLAGGAPPVRRPEGPPPPTPTAAPETVAAEAAVDNGTVDADPPPASTLAVAESQPSAPLVSEATPSVPLDQDMADQVKRGLAEAEQQQPANRAGWGVIGSILGALGLGGLIARNATKSDEPPTPPTPTEST